MPILNITSVPCSWWIVFLSPWIFKAIKIKPIPSGCFRDR